MAQFCLAAYAALLVIAAVGDARARRIPNWLTGGVAALYPVYVLTSPTAVPWPMALAVAGAIFVVGFALFALHALGGGDVKLIAAASLWAGLDHLALFAAVTALTGGVLALVCLLLRARYGVIGAPLAALGLAWSGPARPPAAANDVAAAPSERGTVPYGIAIAAGGLAVAANLLMH